MSYKFIVHNVLYFQDIKVLFHYIILIVIIHVNVLQQFILFFKYDTQPLTFRLLCKALLPLILAMEVSNIVKDELLTR